jgi:hypothetical protein
MTVFINGPRNGDRLTEIRREIFPDGNYPGSALITVLELRGAGTADRDPGRRRDRRPLREARAVFPGSAGAVRPTRGLENHRERASPMASS